MFACILLGSKCASYGNMKRLSMLMTLIVFHFEHYNIFLRHTQRPGRKATIIRSEQHRDFANVHAQHKGHVNKIRISLCFYFCALTNCLCRVALLPSVCTMASDVSNSGASAQCRTSAFACLQDFFVKFAPEIVQLQKQNLREVVISHQAKKHLCLRNIISVLNMQMFATTNTFLLLYKRYTKPYLRFRFARHLSFSIVHSVRRKFK